MLFSNLLKARVQENLYRLKNVRLRFSFWAHMLLSWVSLRIGHVNLAYGPLDVAYII